MSDENCLEVNDYTPFKKKSNMSNQDIDIMNFGDKGQGDRLFNSKKK